MDGDPSRRTEGDHQDSPRKSGSSVNLSSTRGPASTAGPRTALFHPERRHEPAGEAKAGTADERCGPARRSGLSGGHHGPGRGAAGSAAGVPAQPRRSRGPQTPALRWRTPPLLPPPARTRRPDAGAFRRGDGPSTPPHGSSDCKTNSTPRAPASTNSKVGIETADLLPARHMWPSHDQATAGFDAGQLVRSRPGSSCCRHGRCHSTSHSAPASLRTRAPSARGARFQGDPDGNSCWDVRR